MAGAVEDQLKALASYGQNIGLAFQVSDDILDIEGDSGELGKNVGSDTRQEKITYPAVVGLKRSKEIQKELVDRAIESLAPFDQRAEPLRHIAKYIIARRT